MNLFAICAPPLLTACYYYKREIVELLLKQGANPNVTSFAGREVIAGNPKIYAQMVTLLAPHTSVGEAEAAPLPDTPEAALASSSPHVPAR